MEVYLPGCFKASIVFCIITNWDGCIKVCQDHLETTVEHLLSQLDMGEPTETAAEKTIDSIFFCDFSDPKSDSRSYVEVLFFNFFFSNVLDM